MIIVAMKINILAKCSFNNFVNPTPNIDEVKGFA